MKNLFLLDPDVVFLNHGSFGACPRPVFEAYQRWQLELERQPVAFITSRLDRELNRSRAALARFLGADPVDVLFLPNATHGINQVVRSLAFTPGDEILTTNQEYGACENVLHYVSRKTGAVIVQRPVPLPTGSEAEWVEQFWGGVNARTRLIFLSHITSATAQCFPIEAVCRRAREAGIKTLVDGAHAPGQIDLDLEAIGADFYTGNCHKWLMAPKGAGFLHARRAHHGLIEPLVVGWGMSNIPEFSAGSTFLDQNQWLGTDDFSSYIAIAEAVAFQSENDWASVRFACSQLLGDALGRIRAVTGKPDLVAPHDRGRLQMGIAELPRLKNIKEFKIQLLADFKVEIPCIDWGGRHFIRVSIQAYNNMADIDRLLAALEELLPVHCQNN